MFTFPPLRHLIGIILFIIPTLSISATPAKVLVVHSYEQDHVCGRPQGDGVEQALKDKGWTKGENLELVSYYMNTKKIHTTPKAMRRQADLVKAKIDEFNPRVVVLLDDNAIREVMLPLISRKEIAFVFTGMNGQPEDYNKKAPFMVNRERPGSNVTGVYEKLWISKSLVVMEAALNGFAQDDKVVGITDFSPTGNAITRQFELELSENPLSVKWELHRVKDFTEYQALIKELNNDPKVRAIYPAALRLETDHGDVYTAKKIFEWTTANSRAPEMALNYFFSKIGLFGGAAVDFAAMGYMAGERAARILRGEKAGAIPIEEAKEYAIVFNHKRANELGIKIPDSLLTAADHVYR